MELSCEESCCSAGNNQAAEQAGITQHSCNCQADDRQELHSSAGNCQADEQTLITQLSRPGSRD